MTNQEVNEFLAEKMFGLVEKRKGSNCYYDIKTDEPRCCGCPDYITNYQPVLEKLLENVKAVRIDNFGPEQKICQILKTGLYPFPIGTGNTVGEAVCKAAVAYIKAGNHVKNQSG